jgi:hypothetical protein
VRWHRRDIYAKIEGELKEALAESTAEQLRPQDPGALVAGNDDRSNTRCCSQLTVGVNSLPPALQATFLCTHEVIHAQCDQMTVFARHVVELEAAQRSGNDEQLRLVMHKLNASVRESVAVREQ